MVNEDILQPRRPCWWDLPAQHIQQSEHPTTLRRLTRGLRGDVRGTTLDTPAVVLILPLDVGETLQRDLSSEGRDRSSPRVFWASETQLLRVVVRQSISRHSHRPGGHLGHSFYIGRTRHQTHHLLLLRFARGAGSIALRQSLESVAVSVCAQPCAATPDLLWPTSTADEKGMTNARGQHHDEMRHSTKMEL